MIRGKRSTKSKWYDRTSQRPGYEVTGAKGDNGEDIVWKLCEKEGWEYESYLDRDSQVNLKIDGKINGKLIDVKNNMFKGSWHGIELDKYRRGDGQGWFNTTEAEQIYAVNEKTKSVFVYSIKKMRKVVEDLIERSPHRYKRLSKSSDNTAWGVYIDFHYIKWNTWEVFDSRDEKVIEEEQEKISKELRECFAQHIASGNLDPNLRK